jgi:ribosomal protein S18 acetylase RimI-like enzyme
VTVEFRLNFRPSPGDIGDLRESVGWSRWEQDYPSAFDGYAATVSAHVDDGRLVGWVAVISDNLRHAFLVDVMVDPDFQRQGIGTTLVRRAVEEMRARGITLIHVDCTPEHAKFYEGCGFRIGVGGWMDLTG